MEIVIDNYTCLSKVAEMLPNMSYLEPYDAKSFYKKARVYEGKGIKVLVSYETPVVLMAKGMVFKLQRDNRYTLSQTTMRHINAFLKRENVKGTCKREWRNVTAE